MIKPIRMTVSNIGVVEHIEYNFDKSLLVFFGEVRQGKTTATSTALNLLKGGAFPPGILREGTKQGFVKLDIEGGSITREFYVDPKDGLTKAHEIVFLRDNNPVPVKRPVEQLRALFGNPFLADGDFLKRMGPTDRKAFFVQLLNIDTGELDAEKKDILDQNLALQAKIDGYGDISEEPVLAVDKAPIKAAIATRKQEHASKVAGWQSELDGLRLEWQSGKRHSLEIAEQQLASGERAISQNQSNQAELRKQLAKLEADLDALRVAQTTQSHAVHVLKEEVALTPRPGTEAARNKLKAQIATPCDTSDLDQQLEDAAAQDVRVQTYQANLVKIEQRKRDNELLGVNKDRLKEIKELKAQMLAKIAEDSGIKDLAFDEDGDFVFEKTVNGMISTSQHARLALALKSLLSGRRAPIEICDRAESLGVDIFKIIDGRQGTRFDNPGYRGRRKAGR